jgi:putative transposase
MYWKQLLTNTTDSVNEELRLRNAYLAAGNRILRQQINSRVPLSDRDRHVLAKIGKKLGKPVLEGVATIAKPDTILP